MTHGIGNEWDPGDPPEIHAERRAIRSKADIAMAVLLGAFDYLNTPDASWDVRQAQSMLVDRMNEIRIRRDP